jgi:sterol desaturase/sphingolipid hydroxylase (fatty acid hydroxylase superfamily)
VLFSPVIIPLVLFVSLYSAATLVMVIVAHNLVWGAVHVQMHVPESNRWFRDTAYFRFIARHHFMHHQRMGKNYNVVLPLADFIMGAATKPRVSDVREMLRLGYLKPRTALGQRRLDLYRRKQEATRPAAIPLSVPPVAISPAE